MGMYTELVLKCSFNKRIDTAAMEVFQHLFNNGDAPSNLPDHEFFKCDRWNCIGSMSSFYHHPSPVNSWVNKDFSQDIQLFSRSDLKNYDDEIEKFLDWANPYIDETPETCIGYSWYEEADEPTLIFKR